MEEILNFIIKFYKLINKAKRNSLDLRINFMIKFTNYS